LVDEALMASNGWDNEHCEAVDLGGKEVALAVEQDFELGRTSSGLVTFTSKESH
jgi:hypothetical protein